MLRQFGIFRCVGAQDCCAPGQQVFSTTEFRKGLLANATQQHQTQKETQNASRRRQAFQNNFRRKNSPHALRQAPPAWHKEARPHAQAQKADAGEPSRPRRREANASLRRVTAAAFVLVGVQHCWTPSRQAVRFRFCSSFLCSGAACCASRKMGFLLNRARQRVTGACRPMRGS